MGHYKSLQKKAYFLKITFILLHTTSRTLPLTEILTLININFMMTSKILQVFADNLYIPFIHAR